MQTITIAIHGDNRGLAHKQLMAAVAYLTANQQTHGQFTPYRAWVQGDHSPSKINAYLDGVPKEVALPLAESEQSATEGQKP